MRQIEILQFQCFAAYIVAADSMPNFNILEIHLLLSYIIFL